MFAGECGGEVGVASSAGLPDGDVFVVCTLTAIGQNELGAQVAVDPVHRIVDDVHMILQPSLAVESCVKITVEIAPGHRI